MRDLTKVVDGDKLARLCREEEAESSGGCSGGGGGVTASRVKVKVFESVKKKDEQYGYLISADFGDFNKQFFDFLFFF